jgi:hypothetical protein
VRALSIDGVHCYLVQLCKCLNYDQLLRPSQVLDQSTRISFYHCSTKKAMMIFKAGDVAFAV